MQPSVVLAFSPTAELLQLLQLVPFGVPTASQLQLLQPLLQLLQPLPFGVQGKLRTLL